MASSISMSVLVDADDIDQAKVRVVPGPIPSFRIYGTEGTVCTIQGYHVDPHDFAFAIRALGDRLVQAADDWAQAQNPNIDQTEAVDS